MTQAARATGGFIEEIPTGAGPRETSITVVFVDDDSAFADLVAGYLEREHSFEVHAKTDGQAALDHLESTGGVDCIVSDYEMPGIDGIELLKAIKSDHSEIPFVMFAGQGSEEVASRAIQHGADDYLRKDTGETRYELLATRIRSCVTIARQQRHLHELSTAIENAGHAMLLTDRTGTITYANPTMEQISGYGAKELIGKTPAVLQSGEHGREFYEEIWRTILDGDVWEGELINERKDGDRYVINQTIAPITDTDGDITGFVAINQDITERKERERNLTFLKRAVDQAGIGLGTYDETGEMTYVNQRLAEITGVAPSELKRTSVTALNPEFDPDRFEDYWKSFEEGDHRVFESSIQRLDTDETVPAEVVSSRVRIDGESYQVTSVRDITERKERERELDLFRKAVEHAGHGVMITDRDGTIEYVNDAFLETSGYAESEVIGKTPALLKSGVHDRAFYADLWDTIQSGEVWREEVTNERKGGQRYVVDQTIAPITDEDGRPTEFVAINNDITDLKEYERELEAQNEYLEQYGETVAHDLRNPLTLLASEAKRLQALIGDADIDAATEASLQESCQNVQDVLDQMSTLIEDLLTMAKQGQVVLDATEVHLRAVSSDAWEQIDAPDATFSVDETTIEADPDRLQELLSNLFRNAIEHGGPDVTIRSGPLSFSEGFYVADDGPGIPEAERERVLERGYTTAKDGTGFGLAIVAQIAEAHDWAVSISESKDGGARFEFRPEDG